MLDLGAAPAQRVVDAAMRADNVVTHAGVGVFFTVFDVTQALDARRRAGHQLGERRALEAASGQRHRVG